MEPKNTVVIAARVPKSFQKQMRDYMIQNGYMTPSELIRVALRKKFAKPEE